ncbi:hypothetical protein V6N13_148463 [Hibiscus sabdariffa]|uniref:Uncharacterized protein n=1 Tax=Hibiscus sabdariffa TaxID=183260 RepID=A0ABR2TYM6_9ROSI
MAKTPPVIHLQNRRSWHQFTEKEPELCTLAFSVTPAERLVRWQPTLGSSPTRFAEKRVVSGPTFWPEWTVPSKMVSMFSHCPSMADPGRIIVKPSPSELSRR